VNDGRRTPVAAGPVAIPDVLKVATIVRVAGVSASDGAAFAGEKMNDSDGVRIDFADGGVHLRASNTEPIARIIAEAPTAARAQELIAMCAKAAGL